jgi:hypothetical protein
LRTHIENSRLACETVGVPGLGWWSRFLGRSWTQVREFEDGVWADTNGGQYIVAIIDSVLANEATDVLAVTTSMHDLVVVARPVPDPPMDVLILRSPVHSARLPMASFGSSTSPSQVAIRKSIGP